MRYARFRRYKLFTMPRTYSLEPKGVTTSDLFTFFGTDLIHTSLEFSTVYSTRKKEKIENLWGMF